MSYQKQNFANGDVLNAAQLNYIEDGIVAEEERAEEAEQSNAGAISAEKERAEKAEQNLSDRTDNLESLGLSVVNGQLCMTYTKEE